MRKISAFFWYQNHRKFEKKKQKQSDRAPLMYTVGYQLRIWKLTRSCSLVGVLKCKTTDINNNNVTQFFQHIVMMIFTPSWPYVCCDAQSPNDASTARLSLGQIHQPAGKRKNVEIIVHIRITTLRQIGGSKNTLGGLPIRRSLNFYSPTHD